MAGLRISLSQTHPLVCCEGSPVSHRSASQSRLLSCREHLSWTGKAARATHTCSRVVCALGGSFDEGSPAVFPRINVRDPYKRLGISREASEEEIREAHNFLIDQYAGHEKSKASIEAAYDKIIMESFNARRRSKVSLQSTLKKKYAELPPWVRNISNIFDVPSTRVILTRAIFFALLVVWSILNQAQGGPAFQVAVSLAGCIYFLNERLKSKWKALLFGIGSFVIGWIFGSIVVPFLPAMLYPRSWSIELVTALISYVFLWLSCTFLRNTA